MSDHLINRCKSMSSIELLTEISKGNLGSKGSPNRDIANHLLKIKEKEEDWAHNEKILKYMQNNYRLNFALSVATIALALTTIGILYFGSNGIKERQQNIPQQKQESTQKPA
jgi:hypothetical protein